MATTWMVGTTAFGGRVLEVRGIRSARTKLVVGWEARLRVGNVAVVTERWFPTAEEAEEAVRDSLNCLVKETLFPNGVTP